MQYHANARRSASRRGGYLYLAVLFTSLIVVAVVTASMSLSTANSRAEIDRVNRMSAVRLAESEIHRIAATMQTSSSWRSDSVNNAYSSWRDLSASGVMNSDTSQVRHRFNDVDLDLNDDLDDSVSLTVHAQVGRSHAGITVDMEPRYDPLALLGYGVTATDDIEFQNGAVLSVELPVQVGDDCKTSSSGVLTTPLLECSGNIEMVLRGDAVAANVVAPSHDVVAKYAETGTSISVFSLPLSGGYRELRNVVLTAGDNPYGTVDPEGIYKIDAQGASIRISNSRIDATLIIQNAPYVDITDSITWSFPNQADAILVTDANINFVNIDPNLSETAQGVNFNPSTSPYRGSSNSDTNDFYPTELRGIIYTTNDLGVYSVSGENRLSIAGAIICKDLDIEDDVSVRQLSELLDGPPVPFSDWVPMQFIHGTFRRVAVP